MNTKTKAYLSTLEAFASSAVFAALVGLSVELRLYGLAAGLLVFFAYVEWKHFMLKVETICLDLNILQATAYVRLQRQQRRERP